MQNERSIGTLFGHCLTYLVTYYALSMVFGVVTFFSLVLIELVTPDPPYDMREYAGIGFAFISLGLSFFVLAPVTLIGASLYNFRSQRGKRKEKRKNDSISG